MCVREVAPPTMTNFFESYVLILLTFENRFLEFANKFPVRYKKNKTGGQLHAASLFELRISNSYQYFVVFQSLANFI